MRILIDIPEEQITALAIISGSEKTSRSEIVRRAIALYIEQTKPSDVEAFGIWRDHQVDGITYQERLRSEW